MRCAGPPGRPSGTLPCRKKARVETLVTVRRHGTTDYNSSLYWCWDCYMEYENLTRKRPDLEIISARTI